MADPILAGCAHSGIPRGGRHKEQVPADTGQSRRIGKSGQFDGADIDGLSRSRLQNGHPTIRSHVNGDSIPWNGCLWFH